MSVQERRKSAVMMSGAELREATRVARSQDVEARRELSARPDLPPELLFYLAEDKDDEVRRRVAANANTPRQADQFLARDHDEGVRAAVADRMAAVAGGLSAERRTQQRMLGLEVLETLARDAAAKVRARLSEALGDVGRAPGEVVEQVIEVLARDTTVEVARPVLERSPLLSDDLLVALVERPCAEGTRAMISRRRTVSERVADAIVDSGEDAAITVLLTNGSAQIREETLDSLIEAAPAKPDWHAPLVRRPRLAARHIDRLSEFVAAALVDELANRNDIDAASSQRLRLLVSQRIDADAARGPVDPAQRERRHAMDLHADGRLGPKVLEDALRRGRRAFLMAALSVRSGLDEPVVHAMVNSGSARAVAALAWKCELPMATAELLQRQLAYIPAEKVIVPGIRGEYTIEPEVLDLQVKLFAEGAAGC